jgi:integrase/recombinase XerD
MMSTAAKTLAPGDVRRLQTHVAGGRFPVRDQAIVMLSFKAGLRACEIAGLDWTMVLGPRGRVGDVVNVAAGIAKNGRSRRLPLNKDLKRQLTRLHVAMGKPRAGPVVRSQRGGHMRAKSVVNWFRDIYADLGFDGCSSHSGRRTFITQSARLIAKTGGSLRDVQELAGHSALTTTERYIEGNRDAQRKLVALL